MADQNIFTTQNYLDVVLSGKGSELNKDLVVERTIKTGLTTAKPGMFVGEVGETHPDVDLTDATDTSFLGILWKHANEEDIPADWQNPDASSPVLTFAAGVRVLVILPHAMKLLVAAYMSPNTTTTAANDVTGNELLRLSSDTTADGELDVESDPLGLLVVGRANSRASVTGDASNAKVVEMWY